MSNRVRSMTMVVLGSLLVLAMGSTAALAQYPTAPAFSVACIRAAAPAQPIVCSVVGAFSNERLTASASASPPFWTEVLYADDNGEASFEVPVPDYARDRAITVTVVGDISGDATTTQVEVPTTGQTGEAPGDAVDAPGRSGEAEGLLARTGQNTAILALGGALALAIGGGALVRSRNRTRDGADA